MMKTIFSKKNLIIVLAIISSFPIIAQTQGSGSLGNLITSGTNRCIVGTGGGSNTGNDNSFFGSAVGYQNTTGNYNTFIGKAAGYFNNTGINNTFLGNGTGGYAFATGSVGADQTFIGAGAGSQAGYGAGGASKENTFVGMGSGQVINSGAGNTFVGARTSEMSTSATDNTFIGYFTANSNSTGSQNTLLGNTAGRYTTVGGNVLIGYSAGIWTSTANNTLVGFGSAYSNTTGASNVAYGFYSLYNNTIGTYNTALGYQALYRNTNTGANNTAVGLNAGYNITWGTNNTFLGYGADVNAGTYSNCAAIGNGTVVSFGNKMFLGNNAITHIQGQVGFSTYSDGRFKTEVTENVKGLEFINKLRPVTYKLNTEALDNFIIQNMDDSIKTLHQQSLNFGPSMAMVRSGFIAQEVEAAAQQVGFSSSIVSAPGNESDPYSMSYAEMVVPLVKATQELSKIFDSLKMVAKACCHAPGENLRQKASDSSEVYRSQINVELSNKNIVILDQNIPNPFADQTFINYSLPDAFNTAQIIFIDQTGKRIKTVELKEKGKGILNVFADDLTSGIYTYSLIIDGKVIETKKMLKVK